MKPFEILVKLAAAFTGLFVAWFIYRWNSSRREYPLYPPEA